jgi:hypothetical protein
LKGCQGNLLFFPQARHSFNIFRSSPASCPKRNATIAAACGSSKSNFFHVGGFGIGLGSLALGWCDDLIHYVMALFRPSGCERVLSLFVYIVSPDDDLF